MTEQKMKNDAKNEERGSDTGKNGKVRKEDTHALLSAHNTDSRFFKLLLTLP